MWTPWLFSCSFQELTFEERVTENHCSINRNSDEGEGLFFAKKIQAASLNCLNKAIAIISVSKFFAMFLTFFK